MNSIKELKLGTVRKGFDVYGITITDEEFSKLTIKEIDKYFKKAKKAYKIRNGINKEIRAKFKKKVDNQE